MEKQARVVVYGNSLNMAGIAASLKAEASLDVICVDPISSLSQDRLSELHPRALAFDLNELPQGVDVKLLRQKSGLLLIGVDPSSDELLVLYCQPRQALCISDLVNIIGKNIQNLDQLLSNK